MKNYTKCTASLIVLIMLMLACNAQEHSTPSKATVQKKPGGVVGGPFETGEYIYIDMPENINATDTSAGWNQIGQRLLVKGRVYKVDGKTPAPNVIIYYYHTDISGHYSSNKNLNPSAARHGYIRGWVKTDRNGQYAIYTVRPAPYPGTDLPAHIHPTIKEPEIGKEYYIDEFVFDDDPRLTTKKRAALDNRGGSGIMKTTMQGDLQVADHDIILGLNIPNYPKH